MQEELLKLLEDLGAREAVGTLVVGKGNRARRFFFTGHEVHLLDAGKECRFVPSSAFFDNDRVSTTTFHDIFTEVRFTPQSVRALLDQRGLLTREQSEEMTRMELVEEMLFSIGRSSSFEFGEGNVPQELLLPTSETVGVPTEMLIDALRVRIEEKQEIAKAIPSQQEVPVLSPKGEEKRDGDGAWIFSQLAVLIDGDRTVREIVGESLYFPHLTLQVLTAAARKGWLKKTRFPELEELEPTRYTPFEAREICEQLETAAEMAADTIPLRRTLAAFYLRAGLVDRAVHAHQQLGDLLRKKNDYTGAIAAYQEALRWEPNSNPVRDSLVNVYLEQADNAKLERDPENERRYLGEALRYRVDDLDLYMRAVHTFGGNEAQVLQLLPRFLQVMEQDPREDLPLRFFVELQELFPESVAIRKRHVNLLLDYGKKEKALEELQYLAGFFLDRGRKKDAARIYAAMARLKPDQRKDRDIVKLLSDQKERKTRHNWRASPVSVIALVVILATGVHHIYAYTLLAALNQKAHALSEGPLPTVGTPEFESIRSDTERLANEFDSFGRLHFLTAWGAFGRRQADELEDMVLNMEQRRQTLHQVLWDRAEEANIRGRLDEARKHYNELIERGKGTHWDSKARDKIEYLDRYEEKAREVLAKADEAYRSSSHHEAFELYMNILKSYPRSSSARTLSLPVKILTAPTGAEIRLGETLLGRSPLLLKVNPHRTVTLKVDLEGYKSKLVRITDIETPELEVELQKVWED